VLVQFLGLINGFKRLCRTETACLKMSPEPNFGDRTSPKWLPRARVNLSRHLNARANSKIFEQTLLSPLSYAAIFLNSEPLIR
jgi:hypothetical protein